MSSETNSVRTTGRIKKPKAVFDPSDYNVPRNQRISAQSSTLGSSSSSTSFTTAHVAAPQQNHQQLIQTMPATTNDHKRSTSQVGRQQQTLVTNTSSNLSVTHNSCVSASASMVSVAPSSSSSMDSTLAQNHNDLCFICMKREAKRGSYTNRNKLINCVVCLKKVHRLCLKLEFESLNMLSQNYHCDECRFCEICFTSDLITAETKDMMVTCVKCIKSYHIFCHVPPLTKQQRFQPDWKCDNCSLHDINILGDNVRNNSNSNNNSVQKNSTIMTTSKVANNDCLRSKSPSSYNSGERKLLSKQLTGNAALSQQQSISAKISNSKSINPTLRSTASETSSTSVTTTIRSCSQEENKQKSSIKKPKLDDFVGIPPLKMINNHKETLNNKMIITSSSNSGKNGISSGGTVTFNHQTGDGLKVTTKKRSLLVNEQPRGGTVTSSPPSLMKPYNISEEPIIVPDVKNWSVDQVADYFAKYFPNEAQVFRDQEIDGMSLLLLKRSDIVKKLPFKLGPSLRLYSFILKIQTKLNDPTLGWHTASSS